MEIPPLLPIDASTTGVGAASLSPGAGSPAAAVAAAALEAAAPAGPVAPLADQVRIHPLDVVGALQILIAEVRADLSLPGDVPQIEVAVPSLLPASVQANAPAVPLPVLPVSLAMPGGIGDGGAMRDGCSAIRIIRGGAGRGLSISTRAPRSSLGLQKN